MAELSLFGKVAVGETSKEALYRELKEEIGIVIGSSDVSFFESYSAPASDNERVALYMDVYQVHSYEGTIEAGHEIVELKWLTSENINSVKVSSIFRDKVFPELRQLGLVK